MEDGLGAEPSSHILPWSGKQGAKSIARGTDCFMVYRWRLVPSINMCLCVCECEGVCVCVCVFIRVYLDHSVAYLTSV